MTHSLRWARYAWSVSDAAPAVRLPTARHSPYLYTSIENRSRATIYASRYASTLVEAGPRIAQPSFWKSLIPKPFRGGSQPQSPPSPSNKPERRTDWNPFVVYIAIFMLIGSNAINLIGVRNDLLNFSQKTDRQIALLKEVIRKVQNGEKVDIEAVLGTGDPEQEKDWEEALKEIESTDALYNNELRKRQEEQRRENNSKPTLASTSSDARSQRRTGFY